MVTSVDPLPHDLGVLTALQWIPGAHPVGFAEAPEDALEHVIAGDGPDYLILWPISSTRDGSIEDPWSHADFVYQVTVVAHDAKGARWLVGQIEPALRNVTIAGRSVVNVIPEDASTVRLDTNVKPDLDGAGVFIATPRYRLATVPTT